MNAAPACIAKCGVHATAKPAEGENRARLAVRIRNHWAETLESIVESGRMLAEGRFRKGDYTRYSLPFSYSWGKKLVKISECPRVLNPANRSVLPDKADALHQIALLTDWQFDLAMKEGVIHRGALVIDLKNFRRSFVGHGSGGKRRLTVVYECAPQRGESATESLETFVGAVERLALTRFPSIAVRRPRTMKELVA